MEQYRQMYVKRELRRRRAERKRQIRAKVAEVAASIGLVVVSEAFFFALILM